MIDSPWYCTMCGLGFRSSLVVRGKLSPVNSKYEHTPLLSLIDRHACLLPALQNCPCTCKFFGQRKEQKQALRDQKTYKMRSACRVRFPNRCEENIMVLLPLKLRRRSKRSVSSCLGSQLWALLSREKKNGGNAPCSAVGSREALGSSNNSMPTEDSVSDKERMNVRELCQNSQHPVSCRV